MSSDDIEPLSSRKAKHTYTEDDRIILSLLFRMYHWKTQKDHMLAVFNKINRHRLLSEGFPTGELSLGALVAQHSEMLNGGTGSDVWQEVNRYLLSEADSFYATQMGKIKAAENDTCSQDPSAARRMYRDESPYSLSTSSDSRQHTPEASDHEDLPQPNERVVRDAEYPLSDNDSSMGQVLLRRPSSIPLLCKQHDFGNRIVTCPTLLFRGFERQHGLRARRFVDTDGCIPPPPRFETSAFRKQAAAHLSRKIPYASPFVSLAQNPRNALKWVGENRDLAILLFQDVFEDAQSRYGEVDAPYPYLSHSVILQHELLGLPGNYVGRGEFLAWGSIECQPIAIFEHEEAVELQMTMESIDSIDDESGYIVAKFFSNIADKFKELVAYKLLRSFKVEGWSERPQGSRYDEYINAIYTANHADRASSILSEMPTETTDAWSLLSDGDDSYVDDCDQDFEEITALSDHESAVPQNEPDFSTTDFSREPSVWSSASTTQLQVEHQIRDEARQFNVVIGPRFARPRRPPSTLIQEIPQDDLEPSPTTVRQRPANYVDKATMVDLTADEQDDVVLPGSLVGSGDSPIEIDSDGDEVIEVGARMRRRLNLPQRNRSESSNIITAQQKIRRRNVR